MSKSTDFSSKHEEQLKKIQDEMSSIVLSVEKDAVECPVVWVKKDKIVEFLNFVKKSQNLEYEFLSDLTAYDELGSDDESKGRFVVVYNLYSPSNKCRMRIKCRLQDGEEIPTVCSVWAGANWAEREVFDMFGIKFEGHPDLRRILMDARWVGHPLRKDYYWRKYQLFTEPEQIPMHLLEDPK